MVCFNNNWPLELMSN